ncbi:MAG: autotransporter-associated beta strand repeat-containing protein, partial [Xanthobacteraceae bacterium]
AIDGVTQGNAIVFTGGVNSLTIQSGSIISGNVVAVSGGTDTFALGGSTNSSFNTAQIGAQYQNFTAFGKTGTSVWTLTGTPGQATPWVISAGTLTAGAATNVFGATSAITVNTPGLLDLGGNNQQIGSLTGSGIVINSGLASTILTTGDATNTLFSGVIQNGAGVMALTKQGAGTFTLTAANTYTGTTTIDAGTLQLGNGGTSGSIVGDVTDNSNFVIDLSANFSMAGVISGSGAFVQLGAGTTIFTTADDYSGATTVDAGTLQLGDGGSLGFGGALNINGGTFDLNGHNQTVGDLSGTGGMLTLGSGTLTTDSTDSTIFAGTISGTGELVIDGTGTLTLTGSNNYNGGTTISDGELVLGNGGTAGSITGNTTDNAMFAIDRSDTLTFAGNILGTGGLLQLGTGTTILMAADSYSGGTTISAGTLQLGNGGTSGSIVGEVTDNAGFAIDRSDSFTFAGHIFGTGSLLQLGAGTTILTAADNYSGGTTITDGRLELGTGGSVSGNVTDNAIFAADSSDAITLAGMISGSGAFQQLGTGTTILLAADTNGGGATVTAGTLELGSGGSIAANVTFNDAGAGATLRFDTSVSQIGGDIAGAATGDFIDLQFQTFASGDEVVWQQNGSTGTLTLETSGGWTQLTLAGTYTSANFTAVADSHGGTQIELVTPPNPPTAANTTADMIMREGGNGDYEIYDIGNNAILAAGPLGQVGVEWQVSGLGDFAGTDSTDMILRDSNNGKFEVYDISNNNITAAALLGQVGLEWTVAGFGDFSTTASETDMMMRNSNTGTFELYDIRNNTIAGAAAIGQVGLEWAVAGFGDFSTRNNESDMLMRNSNTGAFEIYDISNNQLTSAAAMGQVGLEWSVAGFGDFSGNANETDMLMRNKNTGAFEIYDISNSQLTSAAPMGQVGLEWSVVGFGPFNGAGMSDMLMRNTNTGAFEVYDFSNNQLTTAAPMGQVGLEWSVAGIAADAPSNAAPATSLLAQAMASYAPAGGVLNANEPLGEATTQLSSANSLAVQMPHANQA